VDRSNGGRGAVKIGNKKLRKENPRKKMFRKVYFRKYFHGKKKSALFFCKNIIGNLFLFFFEYLS